MDIAVYLPDELGQRAKEAELPFSRLLRAAVIEELDRRDTLAAARGGMAPQKVASGDSNGPLTLRFTGKALASNGESTVWLIEDGRVLLEDPENYLTFDDAQDFTHWVSDERDNLGRDTEETVREAVEALGETVVRVIDL